jgi:hypothetical protein
LEVEIETPRGVSHTFSPLKSEFAFDKLVLNKFCCMIQIYEFVANIAVSVPEGGLGYMPSNLLVTPPSILRVLDILLQCTQN